MSNQCHETAVVQEVTHDDKVIVLVNRSEACGSCAAKGGCTALGGQTKDFTLTLQNFDNAAAGDIVKISISESAVIKASIALYLVPAIVLILGAVLGSKLAPQSANAEAWSLIGAFTGLTIGFFCTWILERVLRKDTNFLPAISKIEQRASESKQ